MVNVRRFYWLVSLGFLLVLCVSCVYTSLDPAFNTVKQALQNEDDNPDASWAIVEANLYKVQDKQIIPFLLDYLENNKNEQFPIPQLAKQPNHEDKVFDLYLPPGHNGEIIILYLQSVSGIQTRMVHQFAGTFYLTVADIETDIANYRQWWNVNKDRIVWDERPGSLKVVRHEPGE